MDIAVANGSHIITVSRAAFARPDTAFPLLRRKRRGRTRLWPTQALAAAMQAGQTRYSDVRGTAGAAPRFGGTTSARNTQNPSRKARVQVTGSGMAAVHVAMSAVLTPGRPPGPPHPRLAELDRTPAGCAAPIVEAFPLDPTPEGGFHPRSGPAWLRPPGRRPRSVGQQPQQPHRLDGDRPTRHAAPSCRYLPRNRNLADRRRGV